MKQSLHNQLIDLFDVFDSLFNTKRVNNPKSVGVVTYDIKQGAIQW